MAMKYFKRTDTTKKKETKKRAPREKKPNDLQTEKVDNQKEA